VFAAKPRYRVYLVDLACSSEDRTENPALGASIPKNACTMPECVKAAMACLQTTRSDQFDAASNARAKRFIAGLKKTKDIKVSVTGTVKDERIAVSKIELQ